MSSSLVTEFKFGFWKQGEREKKENQWASGVQFIHICSKWHTDKQKGFWYIFNDFIITSQKLKDCPDAIGKIEK